MTQLLFFDPLIRILYMETTTTAEEREATREALRRIETCRRKRGSILHLDGLGLTQVPSEIGLLIGLKEFFPNDNHLKTLPREIGDLANLTKLSLNGNHLNALPMEIGQLSSLTELNLDDNQLSTLPMEIGKLVNLTTLSVCRNQLITLPSEIGRLAKLKVLRLGDNSLGALPPEIGQLQELVEIWLQSNALWTFPLALRDLKKLERLFLHGNPDLGLSTLVLGADVREAQEGFTSAKAISEFYFASQSFQSMVPEEQKSYNEVLKRIEECRLTKGEILRISGLRLTRMPREIGLLTDLREVFANNNLLSELPQAIGRLANLTKLSLDDNHLETLPAEIGCLANLKELSVDDNHLETLPVEIGRLANLKKLSLDRNRLSVLPVEIGELASLEEFSLDGNLLSELPYGICLLAHLTKLSIRCNQLTTIPLEIGKLVNMTILRLGENQLGKLPPEIGLLENLTELWLQSGALSTIPVELRGLTKLVRLFLHGNPELGLSPFILGADIREVPEGFATAKSILDFYFARQMENTRPLNEVKLILVGRGGAGKTSAVQALRDMPFREGEESTPGIALCDWLMVGCEGGPVVAHVWDFAGQVITHALHQFFFSVRSVYVVVLTGRENYERNDAEYWLRLIKAFGTDHEGQGPPVIVALNKWDVPGCRPRVDRGALRERYPFIRTFVELDCKSLKGVSELRAALFGEVDKLNWVREPFPEVWDFVRRALADGGTSRAHMTYAEYRQLCADYGVKDEGRQDSLAEILHNLGAALNYRNDPRLREATVLQPEWLTNSVYSLMRSAESHEGVLTQSDVDLVMSHEKDEAMRSYLMQIMERFEIAYAPRTSSGGLWLVPQALPDEQPEGVERFRDDMNATRLRYTYQALPEGLVARAIVRLHEFVEGKEGKKKQWSSGAVLIREEARALVRAEVQDRQVMITVTGPIKARQQLAGLCQAEMRDIHSEIPGLDPLEETQVNGEWVATATLERDEKRGRETGIPTKDGTMMVDPAVSNNAYSERPARSDEVWKPTVFISYSKSNINQRKRLESELKILKNEGLLERGWHDRMIAPGDNWNDVIQRELREADVVIILTSSAALATDYIRDQEIPKALELHTSGETVVIPIILEACRWDKTALGELNALPEKAKPLNTWTRQSDAWKTVADGLATVFETLKLKGGQKTRGTEEFSINLHREKL